MNTILSEQIASRINCERWLLEHDETDKFDAMCDDCVYICKKQWRFAGLVGASGKPYKTAPSCNVLWRFSPFNRYAGLKS
jgi:hypothetical protein